MGRLFTSVFIGCLMTGIGIGMLVGRPDAGALIGMGVGFVAGEILDILYERKRREG